jgi:hypothetical protein
MAIATVFPTIWYAFDLALCFRGCDSCRSDISERHDELPGEARAERRHG